jgi:hypothetical protein
MSKERVIKYIAIGVNAIRMILREIFIFCKYYFSAVIGVLVFSYMVRFRIPPFSNIYNNTELNDEIIRIFNNDPRLIVEWGENIGIISFFIALVLWMLRITRKLLHSEKTHILSAKDVETGEEVLFIPYATVAVIKEFFKAKKDINE